MQWKLGTLSVGAALIGLTLAACSSDKESAKDASDVARSDEKPTKVERQADKTGDAIDEAADDTKSHMEREGDETTDTLDEAGDDVSDHVDNSMEDTKRTIYDATH